MLCMPFNIVGIWLRGLLSIAIIAGGIYLVKRWYDEIAARPAVERGLEVLTQVREQRAITDAEREVYFGKTQFSAR